MQWIDRVRTSLWFIPGVIAFAAFLLASVTVQVERVLSAELLDSVPVLFSGRAAGARAVLTTIATSMITVAGVVFSMTVVSLQLASSQFGPRLLRTFIRDRGNQVVFGVFLGTFLYCILVLPTIDAEGDMVFVPRIAVSIAVLLAVAGLGMLVYFIDHVAQSIHADAVVHAVGRELMDAIDDLYPEDIEPEDGEEPIEVGTFDEACRGEPAEIRAEGDGFLRFVNGDSLLTLASEHDLRMRIVARPGAYITHGDTLLRCWGGADDECGQKLRGAFVLGKHRTTLQDVSFAFEQLTEMAVRALSPGINDPTTALHGLNRVGSGLVKLVARGRPSPVRVDSEGIGRIHAEGPALDEVLRVSVDPIVRCAGHHVVVWERVLVVLGGVRGRARRREDIEALRVLAARVLEQGRRAFDDEADRRRLGEAGGWIDGE